MNNSKNTDNPGGTEAAINSKKVESNETAIVAVSLITPENQIRIDNHKKAAQHHEIAAKIQLDSDDILMERRLQGSHRRAAKHHLDAAKFHEAGEYNKASDSTIKAHWFASLAAEISPEEKQSPLY